VTCPLHCESVSVYPLTKRNSVDGGGKASASLSAYQWTKTLPLRPSFPSLSPFSIQLPVRSNSPRRFSSSTSSTSTPRCSYFSQSSKALKSYLSTETTWVIPASANVFFRLRAYILIRMLECILNDGHTDSHEVGSRGSGRKNSCTYPPTNNSSSPGTRESAMLTGEGR